MVKLLEIAKSEVYKNFKKIKKITLKKIKKILCHSRKKVHKKIGHKKYSSIPLFIYKK